MRKITLTGSLTVRQSALSSYYLHSLPQEYVAGRMGIDDRSSAPGTNQHLDFGKAVYLAGYMVMRLPFYVGKLLKGLVTKDGMEH